jgi:hypothetical protein
MAGSIVLNGKKYGGDVDSVNAKTGAVMLAASDILDGEQTVHDALASKVASSSIVQDTGSSESLVMSQKAVTAAIDGVAVSFVVVEELPETGSSRIIYLLGTAPPYEEYIWVESEQRFEDLGPAAIDLSNYLQSLISDDTTYSDLHHSGDGLVYEAGELSGGTHTPTVTLAVTESGLTVNNAAMATETAANAAAQAAADASLSKTTGITAIEAVSSLPGQPSPTTLYLVG